jgi:hypothetical protein
MPLQDITPLPTAPARSDAPEVFIERADAFVAALPGLVTEINTLGDELELTAALINAAPAYADAGLVALTGLTAAADKVPYWTSSSASATMTVTSAARSVLDDTTTGAMLTTLGFSAFAQTLIDDASASAARTTLGLDDLVFKTGMIMLWSGSIVSIPSGWVICDGTNSTPDLRDKFVVGAGSTYAVAATGGATTHTHTVTVDSATTGASISTTTATVNGDGDPPTCLTSATLNDSGHTHTASTGSGSSLPPYYALAYIMKT